MRASVACRAGRRAGTGVLALALAGACGLLGAGTAGAQPRQVVCTVGPALPAPVEVHEGDEVQLVLVLPLLNATVTVGPAQTVTRDTTVLSATITDVLGLAGQLCQAAVQVQALATSVVPVPALPPLPTVPLLPQTVQLPVPGTDVSVETGTGTGSGGSPPAGPDAGPGRGAGAPGSPGFRLNLGRFLLYDLSAVPYGLNARFGAGAAPAFRFGQRVPGYAPELGILDSGSSDVAGRVQALPLGGQPPVAPPVLLAALMLAAVAGALVRTWTLRRA